VLCWLLGLNLWCRLLLGSGGRRARPRYPIAVRGSTD